MIPGERCAARVLLIVFICEDNRVRESNDLADTSVRTFKTVGSTYYPRAYLRDLIGVPVNSLGYLDGAAGMQAAVKKLPS